MSSNHTHDHDSDNHQERSAAERNRAHFSSPDQLYEKEKPFLEAFAAKWTQEFLDTQTWLDLPTTRPLKMLDYACGPGMASFAAMKLTSPTQPLFSHITGIDIADGMVKLYNERIQSAPTGEITPGTQIHAFRGDLVSTPSSTTTSTASTKDTNNLVPELDPSAQEYSSFNFIATILALHHFEDPDFAVAKLAERLEEGGVLFACDRVPGLYDGAEEVWEGRKEAPAEEGHGHGHGHGHAHGHGSAHGHHHGHGHEHVLPDSGVTRQGFTRRGVEEMFAAAGLVGVKTRLMDLELEMPPKWGGQKMRMFWVMGRKSNVERR